MPSALGRYLLEILLILPPLLPRFFAAWLITFLLLVLFFSLMKKQVRQQIRYFDDRLRHWAARLRYRTEHHMTPEQVQHERMALSWFFRFWTNFASAPSLCFWSLAVPFWMLYGGNYEDYRPLSEVTQWLVPGLCFSGSMLLSFVMKRVFKRKRPPRPGKSFGHRMKDASFPSGHSLTALCYWSTMVLVLAQSGLLAGAALAVVGLGAACIVLLTGMSRVYLGVHFPSDILGGYTIGVVWCIAFHLALQPVLVNTVKGLFS